MPVVDIHTHVYPPSYMRLLQQRTTVPYIRSFSNADDDQRLIILPGEDSPERRSTARGRPVGPNYFDVSRRLAFMDAHGIDMSVISLANPWLDFFDLERDEDIGARARSLNNEMEAICTSSEAKGRLYAFATLPLTSTAKSMDEKNALVDAAVAEVLWLRTDKSLSHIRGVIMGTAGLGDGLDDIELRRLFVALEDARLLVFLHPHHGLPAETFGPRAAHYGHILPLALGFPLETTIAVSRMYLSGLWDHVPKLQFLLAHSGGTLPFLTGRLESCIAHDAHYASTEHARKRDLWEILTQNIYLDAVVYSEVGLKAAIDASGSDRVLFGTDYPFFPPPKKDTETQDEPKWMSVETNYKAIRDAFKDDDQGEKKVNAVLGGNARRVLQI